MLDTGTTETPDRVSCRKERRIVIMAPEVSELGQNTMVAEVNRGGCYFVGVTFKAHPSDLLPPTRPCLPMSPQHP